LRGARYRPGRIEIAYRGSPIVAGAGERYLDESMRGGSGVGSCYLLLIGEDSHPSTVEAAKELCTRLSDVVELRTARRPGMALVRPDGYVAYAAPGRDGARDVTALRAVLERTMGGSR
jgi:hypothetical protein